VKHGVKSIMKIYGDDQEITGIYFVIELDGYQLTYRLPARVEKCQAILLGNLGRRARPETRKKIPKQAERTAWKILSDWVEVQLAMVELAQIEITEVFLPYMYEAATDQTFYEKIKNMGGLQNLLEHQKLK